MRHAVYSMIRFAHDGTIIILTDKGLSCTSTALSVNSSRNPYSILDPRFRGDDD